MMAKWHVPYLGAAQDFLLTALKSETDSCIEWPYARNQAGYGTVRINGKTRSAHNTICRMAHGDPFLIWNQAAHSCGNRICVNPRHIRWATALENSDDKRRHGTHRVGASHHCARITEADVLAIRLAPKNLAPLTEKYGLSRDQISKIRQGKKWKQVGGPRTTKDYTSNHTCRNGHAFTPENTLWWGDIRRCRACKSAADRRYHARRNAAA